MAAESGASAASSPRSGQTYAIQIAGQDLILPIVPVSQTLAISLFMITDQPISLLTHVGKSLATLLAPLEPDVIVAPATLGIPLAIEVSRHLGLEHYVVLQKSPKIHLSDALSVTISSITSKGSQRLLLDRAALPLLSRKRVCVLDDVIASGGSMGGALELARKAEGEVVGIGVVLTEGWEWKRALNESDVDLVRELGHIPQFEKGLDQKWHPIQGA